MSIQPYNMSTLNVNIINVSCTLGISNTERRTVVCDLEQHLNNYIWCIVTLWEENSKHCILIN